MKKLISILFLVFTTHLDADAQHQGKESLILFEGLTYHSHLFEGINHTFFFKDTTGTGKFAKKESTFSRGFWLNDREFNLLYEYITTFGSSKVPINEKKSYGLPYFTIGIDEGIGNGVLDIKNYFEFYCWDELITFYIYLIAWLEERECSKEFIEVLKADKEKYIQRDKEVYSIIQKHFYMYKENDSIKSTENK